MNIKEAELLTGLSAKTIRFYESEGLIFVKRNLNGYRQYSEDTINELKKIKILRKLDISISQIKNFGENKVLLYDILKNRLKDLEENELSMEIKKNIIESMLKDLKKNPSVDLSLYFDDFQYIESEEVKEFMNDINELKKVSLSHQILKTLMLSGPLLWWFYNIFNHEYEFMIINSILVIVSTVILTLTWRKFLKQPDKKTRGTGYMLLILLLTIILSLSIFVIITKLQELLLVSKDYLMFNFKTPYCYIFLFFEIEIVAVFTSRLYKKIKNVEWKWAFQIFHFMRKNIIITAILNLILLYMAVMGITVVTKDQIIDYSFLNPKGTVYSYNDISKVETGFKGKRLKVFKGHAGEFYYIVNFKDGKKMNFYQSNSPFKDTYLGLEIFDKNIMQTGRVKKISSKRNYELCYFDSRYVNRFLRIIDNL